MEDLEARVDAALRRRSTDVEIEGPLGMRARIPIRELTTLLLVAGVAAFGVYLLSQHDSRAAEAMTKIQVNQQLLAEHMDEMIYVMSLSEAERAKLNIAMPDSLLKKTRR